MARLAGKVAVVTGASQGIGEAAARAFAAEGCHVLLAARSEARLAKLAKDLEAQHKVRALAVPTDVRSWDAIQALAAAAKREFHHVDVLVNNAGVGIGGTVLDMSVEHLDETLEVNLRGPFLVSKALVPLMREGGTVLNIASVVAREGIPGLSAYSASKAGLRNFSEALAKELAPRGLRVVCVMPGYVATAMVSDAPFQEKDMVQPEHLAEVLVQLATQPDSVYVDEVVVWPRSLYSEE